MEQLKALHTEAWQARGKAGVFSSELFNAFHTDYMNKALRADNLVLFSIADTSGVLAVFYGLVFRDTLFYYQSGIARRSTGPGAGALMHLVALRIARKRNLKRYDLMRGSTHSYKRNYTPHQEPLVTITATRGRARLWDALKSKRA